MTAQQEIRQLAGKHVVVVGGSSGMGLAVARQAAAAGARLTLLARDPDRLRDAAAQAGNAKTIRIDLRQNESVAAAAEEIGPLDHLVITAGVFPVVTLANSTPEDWRGILEERLIGPLTLVKALAPGIRESILFFSGIVSRRPSAGMVPVAAALAGIESAARALAIELAPIRVNALVPGAVDTPMLDRAAGAHKAQVVANVAAKLPVGRIGSADDVAAAALFLMTNPYMTGSAIEIAGGGHLT
jgi:NAD(P)-dependent dehydrogenase (short-subunit alcohol dehydrogenase family)